MMPDVSGAIIWTGRAALLAALMGLWRLICGPIHIFLLAGLAALTFAGLRWLARPRAVCAHRGMPLRRDYDNRLVRR